VWEEKKIVFEIQCSPISKEEAEARCKDYEQAGYTPVWILYAKRFNRKNLSDAEDFLRKKVCFFADGFKIYDQFEILERGKRIFRGPPLSVQLDKPLLAVPFLKNPPSAVLARSCTISFQGDLLHRLSEGGLSHLKHLEKKFHGRLKNSYWKRLYKEFFYTVLAKLAD
jgi:competence protein CoiA